MRNFALTYLIVFISLCAGTWLIWARLDYPLTGIDDANIFFVYAQNFSRGHGFVYNAGGERVEGFSSILWTLVCMAVFAISDQPELVLLLVNLLILSLGITAAISYLRFAFFKPGENRHAALLGSAVFLVLLVSSPTYLIWNTLSLMENAVWSTLLLLATIVVIREDPPFRGINFLFIPLMILLLLTRPESFLWVGIFTAILLLRKTIVQGPAGALRDMAPVFAVILLTITVLTAFRLWYFGYPLPNTYYAKVSPSRLYNFLQGARYFVKYFVSNPVVSLSILAAAVTGVDSLLSLAQRRCLQDGRLFLPAIAGAGLFLPMITGGDHFSSFRFYQGIYPILLLCLFYFIRQVLPRYIQVRLNSTLLRGRQLIFLSSLAAFLLAGLAFYQLNDWVASREVSRMSDEFEFAEEGREQGRFIYSLFSSLPELPSVGVIRAGGTKYAYPGEVIDLMGINNVLMAHNGGRRVGEKNHAAFEKRTFYVLQPDLVSAEIVSNREWEYRETDLEKSWDNTVALKGLYNDAAFQDRYVYAKVSNERTGSGRALAGWFHKDFLSELEASGMFAIERYEYKGKVEEAHACTGRKACPSAPGRAV